MERRGVVSRPPAATPEERARAGTPRPRRHALALRPSLAGERGARAGPGGATHVVGGSGCREDAFRLWVRALHHRWGRGDARAPEGQPPLHSAGAPWASLEVLCYGFHPLTSRHAKPLANLLFTVPLHRAGALEPTNHLPPIQARQPPYHRAVAEHQRPPPAPCALARLHLRCPLRAPLAQPLPDGASAPPGARRAVQTAASGMPTHQSARLPACLPARLPACPPACLPTSLPVRLPACPPARLPTCAPDRLHSCMSTRLPI